MPGARQGLMVIELVIALAVLSVLLGIGVPALATLRLDARMTAQVNRFVHAVHLAKQAAHRRTRQIAICKSRDGAQCLADADWSDGWLVFVNLDRDQPPAVDAGEPLLESAPRFVAGRIVANRQAFVFRPFEIRSTNGTLLFCDARGDSASRAVVVSYTGRPRTVAGRRVAARMRCTT